MLGDFYNTMFELSLMLNTAGLYWFGVALVWFGLIREGSYELHGEHPCTLEMIQRKQSHNCCTHKSHKLYEEGRQEKVKSRSITNDKK
ncbi:hypothetical protein T4E_5322 [Trichinella pseudospiralis]|uniref:Uncharacterized protein n=1 Tax=Trichinella pseudospiralis TaxID=6337 RepID=A0A0V0XN96_TRIPS|nr:hypothetical protein T4E_5322 [Trichinella pseudospiralis]